MSGFYNGYRCGKWNPLVEFKLQGVMLRSLSDKCSSENNFHKCSSENNKPVSYPLSYGLNSSVDRNLKP